MARIDRRIVEAGIVIGLIGSFVLHSGGGAVVLFASEIFGPRKAPSLLVVDAQVISEEEFTALKEQGAREPEPQPEEPTEVALAAPEPEPEPEVQPEPEPKPEVEPKPEDEAKPRAPYETAPSAPAQPTVAEET